MLRKLCFLALALLPVATLAQVTLEHSYSHPNLRSVELEVDGFRYYSVDYDNGQIHLFTPDHTLWKTIPVVFPAGALTKNVQTLTQTRFNNTPDVEVIISWRMNLNDPTQTQVQEETGAILFDAGAASGLFFVETNSGTKMLAPSYVPGQLISSTKVWNLTTLTHEQTYSPDLWNVELSQSGVKFYTFDRNSGVVTVYNDNHTVWKTVNIPLGSTEQLISVALSETDFNTDGLLELTATTLSLSGNTVRVVNENGVALTVQSNSHTPEVVTWEGTSYLRLSKVDQSSELRELAGFNQVRTFANGLIEQDDTDPINPVYYVYDYAGDVLEIYDNQFFLDQSIQLFEPINGSIRRPYWISGNVFNPDSDIEWLYAKNQASLPFAEYIVENTSGTQLISLPNASNAYLVRANGYWKMIAQFADNTSAVYGFGATIGLDDLSVGEFRVYPNPTADQVNLFLPEGSGSTTLSIFNPMGQLIESEQVVPGQSQLNISHLGPGTYFLQVEGQGVQKLVKE